MNVMANEIAAILKSVVYLGVGGRVLFGLVVIVMIAFVLWLKFRKR
jgi:hypothetical protein